MAKSMSNKGGAVRRPPKKQKSELFRAGAAVANTLYRGATEITDMGTSFVKTTFRGSPKSYKKKTSKGYGPAVGSYASNNRKTK